MAKREVKFKHVKKTRLSDEQLEKLTALQQVLGCSDAEILRMAVETFTGKLSSHTIKQVRKLPPGVSNQLADLTRAVNAVGVNVNQSTRAMHALIADGLMPAETQDFVDISMAKFCMESIQHDVEKIRQEVENYVLHESPTNE
ncbi:hypothetical protein FRC0360_00688 [Corynebacterium diphtheriae]|nr:hypothetical protein FRC0360_00688 [Corynebacterium diphtheriae]